jgi:sulfite reductase (NADPH) flavoprotein alpha-component
VDALLKAVGLSSDTALRSDFIKNRDVTTLSLKTVENYANATGQKYVKELLEAGEAKAWIVGRQLIDLIEQFPIAIDAEKLRALTRPLSPRAYSIASSRSEVGEEAHLLISAVRYETHGRARKGVASNFAAGLKKGARVRVKLKPNKHFTLPASDRDIIMVGPGTGVAPFRGFVQERAETGASGRNWLLFGARHFNTDFLYQTEWQDALRTGELHRLDVAFSRDQAEKIYVQQRLRERGREVYDWLQSGAHFYVCGAIGMGKDVHATLLQIVSEQAVVDAEGAAEYLSKLQAEGRYSRDVY